MKFEKEAIIRYEKARQLIAKLKGQRSNLIDKCDNINSINDGIFKSEVGELCLATAWRNFSNYGEVDDFGQKTGLNYDECLEEIGCNACMESFKIKRTKLSDAKKEFRAAKISLNALGKRLIKGAIE
jgi:hypothetical protein